MKYEVMKVFNRKGVIKNNVTYYLVTAVVRFESMSLGAFTQIIKIPCKNLAEAREIKESYVGYF